MGREGGLDSVGGVHALARFMPQCSPGRSRQQGYLYVAKLKTKSVTDKYVDVHQRLQSGDLGLHVVESGQSLAAGGGGAAIKSIVRLIFRHVIGAHPQKLASSHQSQISCMIHLAVFKIWQI